MKTGILTIFNGNYNYGGMLQAYALAKVCNDMGYTACQVRFNGGTNIIYSSRLQQCKQYSFFEIISKFREKLLEKKGRNIIDVKLKGRKNLFDKFVQNYIPLSEKYYSISSKNELVQDFDAFVVGSDQVWNPNVVNAFYVLDFPLQKKARKISYAASIGRGYLSKHESSVLKKYLDDFDFISVREASAKELLEKANVVVPIKTVLDPTMLLDRESWMSICADRIIKEKYILLYSFSNCPFQEELKEYYGSMGYKVVYIPYAKQTYNGYDEKSPFTPMWNIGPSEFLSLISYADYIITDSFHGAVFSIIFNRQFFVFNRDSNKAKTSKNARLVDLLTNFNLSDRIIGCVEELKSKKESISYLKINQIRAEYGKQSLEWLKKALG